MNQVYRFERSRNASKSKQVLFPALLGAIWGCAVFLNGGVVFPQANLVLFLLGLFGISYCVLRPASESARTILDWWIYLLPAYVALQLIPLPENVLQFLSPTRAEIHRAVGVLTPGDHFAPLSIVPPITMHHLLLIVGYCLMFVLVRRMTASMDNPWFLLVPLLAVGLLEALLGAAQSSLGRFATGTYANRDHYAGLLEMLTPFPVAYAYAVWRRADLRSSFPLTAALSICGALAAAALFLAGILCSLSRMGFVAVLFSMPAMAIAAFAGKSRKLFPAAVLTAGLLAILILLPSEQLVSRFAQLSSGEEATAGRFDLWRESLAVVRAFPMFGCGLGGFESAFLRYKSSTPMVRDDYAHNDYLQFLIELGIVGFAIGAVMMAAVLARAIRAASPAKRSDSRFLAIGCIGAFTAIGLHSLVDFNLYIPANAMLLSWIAGVATGLRE